LGPKSASRSVGTLTLTRSIPRSRAPPGCCRARSSPRASVGPPGRADEQSIFFVLRFCRVVRGTIFWEIWNMRWNARVLPSDRPVLPASIMLLPKMVIDGSPPPPLQFGHAFFPKRRRRRERARAECTEREGAGALSASVFRALLPPAFGSSCNGRVMMTHGLTLTPLGTCKGAWVGGLVCNARGPTGGAGGRCTLLSRLISPLLSACL
jgi:hypothetical protein